MTINQELVDKLNRAKFSLAVANPPLTKQLILEQVEAELANSFFLIVEKDYKTSTIKLQNTVNPFSKQDYCEIQVKEAMDSSTNEIYYKVIAVSQIGQIVMSHRIDNKNYEDQLASLNLKKIEDVLFDELPTVFKTKSGVSLLYFLCYLMNLDKYKSESFTKTLMAGYGDILCRDTDIEVVEIKKIPGRLQLLQIEDDLTYRIKVKIKDSLVENDQSIVAFFENSINIKGRADNKITVEISDYEDDVEAMLAADAPVLPIKDYVCLKKLKYEEECKGILLEYLDEETVANSIFYYNQYRTMLVFSLKGISYSISVEMLDNLHYEIAVDIEHNNKEKNKIMKSKYTTVNYDTTENYIRTFLSWIKENPL